VRHVYPLLALLEFKSGRRIDACIDQSTSNANPSLQKARDLKWPDSRKIMVSSEATFPSPGPECVCLWVSWFQTHTPYIIGKHDTIRILPFYGIASGTYC
jgi:hypothetical protein